MNRLFETDLHGPLVFNNGSAEYPVGVRLQYFAFGNEKYNPKGEIRFVIQGSYYPEPGARLQDRTFRVSTNLGTVEKASIHGQGSQPARSPLEGVYTFKDLKVKCGLGFDTLNGDDRFIIDDEVMTVSGQLNPGGPLDGEGWAEGSGTFHIKGIAYKPGLKYLGKPIEFSGTWWAGRNAAVAKGRKDDPRYECYSKGEFHNMITGEIYDNMAVSQKPNKAFRSDPHDYRW
jgi:hypothetical protein